MAHYEEQLPEDIERGASGGPGFKTRVLELESGFEQRNRDWDQTRGRWDISYGLMSMEDRQVGAYIHQIRDFFYVINGRWNSFNFKDWTDYEIGDYADPTNDNQLIALGDDSTTEFQIFKRYTFGSLTYDRTVKKIHPTNAVVLLDGSVQTETTHYTLDDNTGIITMVTPPASSGGTGPSGEQVLQVALEFYVPVRFDIDQLNIVAQTGDAGSIPEIPIVEVRIPVSP
jgi:uncharacterized protein (TIGR02217 family)